MLFAGWDQSIAHGAVVVLNDEGRVVGHRAIISSGVQFAAARDHVTCMPRRIRDGKERKDVREVRRLDFLRMWFLDTKQWLAELALEAGDDLILTVEDYAYGAAQGAHQTGEVGGLLRWSLWCGDEWVWPDGGPRVRLLDPSSVKIFATDDGSAGKLEMLAAAAGLLVEADPCLEDGPTQEDSADAVCLAAIGRVEHFVRLGEIPLSTLPRGQRRVFLRTTKAHPVNLLERPYLRWRDVFA